MDIGEVKSRIRQRPMAFSGAIVLLVASIVFLLSLKGFADDSVRGFAAFGQFIGGMLMLGSLAIGEHRRTD